MTIEETKQAIREMPEDGTRAIVSEIVSSYGGWGITARLMTLPHLPVADLHALVESHDKLTKEVERLTAECSLRSPRSPLSVFVDPLPAVETPLDSTEVVQDGFVPPELPLRTMDV